MALPILDGNQSATTLSTILTGGAHIPAHTVVSLGSQAITDVRSAVSGSVVSISNFPSTQTIAGTVTANVQMLASNEYGDGSAIFGVSGPDVYAVRTVLYSSATNTFGDDAGAPVDSLNPLPISGTVTIGNSVTIGSLPAISGTVTAGNLPVIINGQANSPQTGIQIGFYDAAMDMQKIVQEDQPLPVSIDSVLSISGTVTVGNSVTIGSLPAISGTVTANNPSGALTTRFGSVTTANLSQITTAVTNTSRKYLLAQNISAGTVTIGIGFSPTTTQGIQLAAGGGLTFDAFCPTGAVFWLGAVTGAAFTILEG